MTNRVYEFSTWKNSPEWKEAEQRAITVAKNHEGKKFVVAVGDWGVRSFLVLAETKEEAKKLATEFCGSSDKVKVRDVTTAKKYNH